MLVIRLKGRDLQKSEDRDVKKTECDRLPQNRIDTKNAVMEQIMKEIRREKEFGEEKIQVILQFPESSDKAAQIRKEVDEILKKELQRQMKNKKGVVYHEEDTDVIEGQFKSAVGSGR